MIISGIKLPVDHSIHDLELRIQKKIGTKKFKYKIIKKSTDARYGNVSFVYNVEAIDSKDDFKNNCDLIVDKSDFKKRPVVVGSGPCGLFAAYILAKSGACPIVLERGKDVDARLKDIDNFRFNRVLNTSSNVQFGEGGAGTFSDGKLTTQINNPLCEEVLKVFCKCGAPDEIMYLSKPHLGTDNLINIVKNLRGLIIELGGEFHFSEKLRDIIIENNSVIKAIGDNEYETDTVILALGHSARDTFSMLYNKGLDVIAKAFSVGARIEHPQIEVNKCQYGKYYNYPKLGAADYKISYHTSSGRGAYTFCMCPGGEVVAAQSEENSVVTNGMSYYNRDGKNSNSAFLVGVGPSDFGNNPFDGIKFQIELEKKAFVAGGSNYNAPCQRLEDFINKVPSKRFGIVDPTYKPGVTLTDLNDILPTFVTDTMRESIPYFSNRLKFFDMKDALLTGVETRSSSPVRICRDESYQAKYIGLYPAGEGAGYAGGIMSAAVDGIKVALAAIENNKAQR